MNIHNQSLTRRPLDPFEGPRFPRNLSLIPFSRRDNFSGYRIRDGRISGALPARYEASLRGPLWYDQHGIRDFGELARLRQGFVRPFDDIHSLGWGTAGWRAGCRQCDPDFVHRCNHRGCSSCHECSGTSSNSKFKGDSSYKTKDITIRGKSYSVRKSFLENCGKFESDIGKFLDKRKDEVVPDRIVKLLIDCINEESCEAQTLHELVGMNILASNVGAKSAVEYSLRELHSKWRGNYDLKGEELAQICASILLSGKVESGLEDWLKKILKHEEIMQLLQYSGRCLDLFHRHPDVKTKLEILLGLFPEEDEWKKMVM
jgi:hypothetical protein